MSPGLGLFSWVLKVVRLAWVKFQLACANWKQLERPPRSRRCTGAPAAVRRKDRPRIPRAKGRVPLVGTFFDLIAAGGAPQLHTYIDRRHRELGPIFCERLGGAQDAVFVSSASLMRAVFRHEGQYPRHPLPDAWTLYNEAYHCQRGLFFMEGAEWLHNRRILNRFLLNGNLDWMDAYIAACSERFVAQWRAAAQDTAAFHAVQQLEAQLYRWAIDVICCIMFGESAGCDPQMERALGAFAQVVHTIFESSAALMSFPPQLARALGLPLWRRFRASVGEVLQKGSDIIDAFVALCAQDALSFDVAHEPLFHKLQAAGMPLAMLKRIFVDLVIAAGDTTAYTTEWALYLLSQDPPLQERMAREVQDGAGDAPLVRGLLKETLRLYPVAPFVGRYLAADAVIGGYPLKKDTLVLLSLYTAGRDAAHFPAPRAVKPERWLRNEATGELQEVLQAHGTLPFAIGTRSCIGRKIATNQLVSLIAAIAASFQLKCTNPTPIHSVLRLVTVPSEPLQLAIKLREHC